MWHRFLILLSAGAAIIAMASAPTAGQAPKAAEQRAARTKTWAPARTAWGDPDLQGIWRDVSRVPFERPKEFTGREFLTDEEVAAREKASQEYNARVLAGDEMAVEGGQDAFDQIWFYIPGRRVARRTSQIIDPPNGRLPPWTPEQLKRWEAREQATRGRGLADSWEDRQLNERCINTATTLIDSSMGTVKDILQAPGYVAMAIETQNGYDYRIIPLDGRPALGPRIRLWTGDARGHWEGNTLVVEIANLSDKLDGGPFVPASTGVGGMYAGSGETLHLMERYTRVGPETLEYRYTIVDPQTYTRPYTGVRELSRDDQYQLFSPSACHEGNDGLAGQLASARADEKTSLQKAAEYGKARQKRLEEMKAEWKQGQKSR